MSQFFESEPTLIEALEKLVIAQTKDILQQVDSERTVSSEGIESPRDSERTKSSEGIEFHFDSKRSSSSKEPDQTSNPTDVLANVLNNFPREITSLEIDSSDNSSDSDENFSSSESQSFEPVKTVHKNRPFKSFSRLTPNGKKGRYISKKPVRAAHKAFTQILRSYQTNGQQIPSTIDFQIIETTKHSKRKIYNYTGEIIVKKSDVIVQTTTQTGERRIITYKHNYKIMARK
jgi:hypothetical protein